MSSQVCVDASLVLKLVLAEADSQSAHDLWHTWIDSDTEVFAPEHLAFEATSVLRNHVYRGLISPAAGLWFLMLPIFDTVTMMLRRILRAGQAQGML